MAAMITSIAAVLGYPGIVSADEVGQFTWPEPVMHTDIWDVASDGVLGVRAIVLPAARANIARQAYTAEEHRNVQLAINEISKVRKAPGVPRAPEFKGSSGPGGFYVMHTAFLKEFNLVQGSNDGYSQYSLISRVQTVEDVVAKGNRVVVAFRITGNTSGPLFGFKAHGQAINIREQLVHSFDSQGRQLTFIAWSGEDLPFYEQLGGKLEFKSTLNPVAWTVTAPRTLGTTPPTSNAELEERLIKPVDYTAEERRNIQTVLGALARREGLEAPNSAYFARGYFNTDAAVYPILDHAYGKPNGFRISSLGNLKRQVTDIFAKGDRAWVYYVTSAIQTGPLFGVPGDGRKLSWDETAFITFDKDGKIAQTTRFPVQGELYLKLGGQYTFPYGKYWSCDGCPTNPGIAHLNIPGEP